MIHVQLLPTPEFYFDQEVQEILLLVKKRNIILSEMVSGISTLLS